TVPANCTATFPNASCAVTVTSEDTPATTGSEMPLTSSEATSAGATAIASCEPLNDPLAAEMDWVPAVKSVTVKVPLPFVSGWSGDNVARASVDERCTRPAKAVARLPNGSRATTETWPAFPATAVPGKPLTT